MGEIVKTKRGAFFVERRGQANRDTLVFVAGLGDDHLSWEDVVCKFSSSYHCVTLDNRGIGRSFTPQGPYTTTDMAEDVHEILESLSLGTVTAIGSSMGGAICQQWALNHPQEIEKLVLSNTWAEKDQWLTNLMDYWSELARRGAGRDLMYQLALFCFSPDYIHAHPKTVAKFIDLPIPNLRGLASSAHACKSHNVLDRLHTVDIPTLIIGGSSDILIRPEFSQHISNVMPHAKLNLLPTGHMIFWEQPETWSTIVNRFLSS